MIRGLYTAAGGMMVEAARQETITNNLANSETSGFKKDLALQRSHAEQTVIRTGDGRQPVPIGTLGLGAVVDRIYTSYEQGSLQETGRTLDVALTGDGFFAVATPQGTRYTRNGAFSLDAGRRLVTDQGHPVLGTAGPIVLGEGELTVDQHGRIYVDGVFADKIEISSFADAGQLRKAGHSLFAAAEGQEGTPFAGQVRQGFLENANVQVVQEMVRMIAALRAYETNQRVIQAQDEILGKAANEVGSLR